MSLRSWLGGLLKQRSPHPKGRTALGIVVVAGPRGLMRRVDIGTLRLSREQPAPQGAIDAWHRQLTMTLQQERQRRTRHLRKG